MKKAGGQAIYVGSGAIILAVEGQPPLEPINCLPENDLRGTITTDVPRFILVLSLGRSFASLGERFVLNILSPLRSVIELHDLYFARQPLAFTPRFPRGTAVYLTHKPIS